MKHQIDINFCYSKHNNDIKNMNNSSSLGLYLEKLTTVVD